MASQTLIANYSVGETAYFVIFATGNLYSVQVTNIYLKNIDGITTIMYDLIRLDKNLIIQGIPQNQVLSFNQAKASLISYLQTQLDIITNLTA